MFHGEPLTSEALRRCWLNTPMHHPRFGCALALLSGLAEEARERIIRRANEGQVAALKRGARLGRKPKLDEHQQQEARKRLRSGESCREVAKVLPRASLNGGAATAQRLTFQGPWLTLIQAPRAVRPLFWKWRRGRQSLQKVSQRINGYRCEEG